MMDRRWSFSMIDTDIYDYYMLRFIPLYVQIAQLPFCG